MLIFIIFIKNCRGLIHQTLVRQFLIPKTARLNTQTFRLGISAVFVIIIFVAAGSLYLIIVSYNWVIFE